MDIERTEKVYLPVTKQVLRLMTGFGAGRIVGGMASLAPPAGNPLMAACIFVAKFGITGAVANAACKANEEVIDNVFDSVKAFTTVKKTG